MIVSLDLRALLVVVIVGRESHGWSLSQLPVRLLLKFLFVPPRLGLERIAGVKRRNSFQADLLFGEDKIREMISISSIRREALAARGMRLILSLQMNERVTELGCRQLLLLLLLLLFYFFIFYLFFFCARQHKACRLKIVN